MMMNTLSAAKIRIGGALAMVTVALVVAACGSSSTNASAGSAPGNAPSASSPSGSTTSVGTASGADGKYLIGSSGRALYLWVADPTGKSVCAGACAKFWPPVLTKAAPVAAGGVTAGQLGTISRANGGKQVTYDGHPLYYFALDKSKGSVKGQGSDNFGAKWWLVAPTGTAITTSGAAGAAPASSGY
jgi:predicted lipoprotein with Yx(FWY)xxD motif